jgi:LmbE family N-acetylglucosaminyl deacetylase
MDRRSFVQNAGAAVLSTFPGGVTRVENSAAARPGKVLAIAAHPGDGMFTMGAALGQQKEQGGAGVLLSLSSGEKGAPHDMSVQHYGDMQRAATQKAAHLLGVKAILLEYPDAEIPFNEESSLRVCDIIREEKPETVITHWSGSWHKDHQACHLIVRDAIFYAGLATLERSRPAHSVSKVFYAENWEDATNFVPDTYINIEAVYERWIQGCDFYPMWRGQTGFFRYNDYYSSLAIARGCLAGFKRATALMSEPTQQNERLQLL